LRRGSRQPEHLPLRKAGKRPKNRMGNMTSGKVCHQQLSTAARAQTAKSVACIARAMLKRLITSRTSTSAARARGRPHALARGDGRIASRLKSLASVELLILDDWGLQPRDAQARHDLLEILEDRYGRKSTIVTSQLPTASWHYAIGDSTYAAAILDRLPQRSPRRTRGRKPVAHQSVHRRLTLPHETDTKSMSTG